MPVDLTTLPLHVETKANADDRRQRCSKSSPLTRSGRGPAPEHAAYHEAAHKILHEYFGGTGDALISRNESGAPEERGLANSAFESVPK